jgi:hypothetical protein
VSTFGVFNSDTRELVEGGFFSEEAADDSCAEWIRSAQEDGSDESYFVAPQNGAAVVRRGRRAAERHASREEQHARYIDCGPGAWDDR